LRYATGGFQVANRYPKLLQSSMAGAR